MKKYILRGGVTGIAILIIIILSFPIIYATIGYFVYYISIYPFTSIAQVQTNTNIILSGDRGEMDGSLGYKIDNENKKVLFFFIQNNNHELMKEVIVPDIEKYRGYQICYTNFMPTKHCIGLVK
ncbi:hypothetical protein AUJ87_02385 [Candidatus Gracilibacteria bacterium CG1_02_38_174]|nr:MAG: hypothetical protein AUJ87_02385 [Candidatus Gracilibacteria bacterium CG1_02_38_174]